MILIDAIYINNSGGKVLLDYLVENLEKTDLEIFYLLDVRIRHKTPPIKFSNKVKFLSGNLLKRHLFYKRNCDYFSKVFCFGNIPPTFYLELEVYTYFQNLVLIETPNGYTLIQKFKFNLKRQILKYFDHNTTLWLVQSELIKNKLQKKISILPQKVKVLPFYPQFLNNEIQSGKKKYSYIYVSNGNPHKNHLRLINVFCEFYDKHKKGKLILTINEDYPILIALIVERVKKGYPIENIGFVDRNILQKVYLSTEYLIFPSMTESFGLGLIEAIECGCKVIGADLNYTYEVCEPSIIFNPLSNESILKAFEKSIYDDVIDSLPKIKNNINELIELIQ